MGTALPMTSVLAKARRELRQQPVDLRVRAEANGTTVVDSYAARLVREPRRIVSAYADPVADIGGELVNPRPVAPDLRTLPPVLSPRQGFEVHAMAGTAYDIDTSEGTLPGAAFVPEDDDLDGYAVLDWHAFSRWGQVVADSRRAVMLLETSLPPPWYVPREDVRMDLLTPSDAHTVCAYKGQASYWSYGDVTNILWTFYAGATDYVIEAPGRSARSRTGAGPGPDDLGNTWCVPDRWSSMSFFEDITARVKQKAVEWDVQGKAEKVAAELDRVAHEAKDKAAEYADDHRGRIRDGLDKAGATIDEHTDGRYADKVAKAKETVSGGVDKLAEQRPGGATPPTSPTSPSGGYASGAATGTGTASAYSAQPYTPEPYTPDPIDAPEPIDEPPSSGTGWPQDAPRNP